jgi:pimeloyl-ACP methyl ester carboxylesterase
VNRVLHHVRTGNGPPLLLIHGLGMSHTAMLPVATRLSGERECFAVDLPGFGASAPLHGRPTLRALADECASFMAGRGHERFHVAGNSLGGGIALALALDGRALSACALSPVGFAAGWERPYMHVSLWTTKAAGTLLLRSSGVLGSSALARRVVLAQLAVDGGRISPGVYRQTFVDLVGAGRFYATARHAVNWQAPNRVSTRTPITIAWGERDRLLLTRPQARRARERFPDARHLLLTGCGHLPVFDDPDQTARVVLEASAVTA